MNYATNFAIVEDGVVTKVLWGMIYNMSTDFPNAVQVDDLAVARGDIYNDGVFYRNGEKVKTISESMAEMQEALELLGVNVNE